MAEQNSLYDIYGSKRTRIPPQSISEAKIAEDAPAAVSYLDRRNITDLYEALGLQNFVRSQNG